MPGASGAWKGALGAAWGPGDGELAALPPLRMGRIRPQKKDRMIRSISSLNSLEWKDLPEGSPSWPVYDAAWAWQGEDGALTAWDLRWGQGPGGDSQGEAAGGGS